MADALEIVHVHDVYEQISSHFNETRHKPWPNVAEFVKNIPQGSSLLDIGSGNGKYFGINPNIFQVGCDRCFNLNFICHEKQFEAVTCDAIKLPFRNDAFDTVLCIAVLHHFSTENRRLDALNEILRVMKIEGRALVYVWAKEQKYQGLDSKYITKHNKASTSVRSNHVEETSTSGDLKEDNLTLPIHKSRTPFQSQDVLVPWTFRNKAKTKDKIVNESRNPVDCLANQNSDKTFYRFYHVFCEGELEKMCEGIGNVRIVRSYYDQGNWCVILEKISL